MSVFTQLIAGVTGTDTNSLWDAVSNISDGVIPSKEKAVTVLMDSIISNVAIRGAFAATMMGTSAYAMMRNTRLTGKGNTAALNVIGSGVKYSFGSVLNLLTVAFTADVNSLIASGIFKGESQAFYEMYQKALIEPNIEGIPISSPSISTDREVDVGEQMMIVQSTSQKQYWTDNSVPHLKTWNIEGYLQVLLTLDNFYVSKPSLKMQTEFLDICATSRRPVLFKDNRGDFRLVQIVSLHTEEVAEYNNAVKVSIQLKEYKPFYVDTLSNITKTASRDPSVMGDKAV